MSKKHVLSIGGSLIVPNGGIDWKYLKRLRAFVLNEVAIGRKLYLVIGGGATARHYIDAAAQTIAVTDSDKDWLGIHSSRLNAHLVRTVLFDVAHPEIITHPDVPMKTKEPAVVAAGWKPGWSTDYVAVTVAKTYGVKSVINLSNIAYAYNKDPNKFSDAKKLKKVSWEDFRNIVGYRLQPGLSGPFDPIASGLAAELKLTVYIADGKKLRNVEKILAGETFSGTIVG